ncbi:MAG: hypothetical protein KIS92_16840 [Planctomycetota bacterium]|nr:hypothetical protein [Planctomycetota bacterium]
MVRKIRPLDPAARRRTSCMLWAFLGSIVLGVIVPTALTTMHTVDAEPFRIPDSEVPFVAFRFLIKFGVLAICAAVGCGPGALILTGILLHRMMKHPGSQAPDERPLILRAAWLGAIFSFANLPGLLALIFLATEEWAFARIVALYMITGATCGGWIGWQAYRAHHLDRGFMPRFTLGTLISLTMGWGGLLILFGP